MFFTNILLAYRVKFVPRKLPKGHLYRGKYRLVKPVTSGHIAQIRRDLEVEDRNMFYLRNPFLKAVEYQGVPEAYLDAHTKFINKCRDERYKKYFLRNQEHRTLENHMMKSLMNDDRWE